MAQMIEAAYLVGFEPSSGSMPAEGLYSEALLMEAIKFLSDISNL